MTDNVKNKISYFNRVKDHDRFQSLMSNFQDGCRNIVFRNPSNKAEIEVHESHYAMELAALDRPESMPEKQQDPWVRLRSLEEYLQYVVDYGVAILSDLEFRIFLRDVLEQNPPVRSPNGTYCCSSHATSTK